MDDVAAVIAALPGLTSANVEIGYKDPSTIPEGSLPLVLVYNPTTAEPDAPVYGLRATEYSFLVLLVDAYNTDEATIQLMEEIAEAVSSAAMTNSDLAYMNPGSIITDRKIKRAMVGAFLVAEWEGI
jgi:hypothetical protein